VDDMAATPVARSVLVDMEPKVIWQVVERASRSVAPGRWRYQPGGSYAQAGGVSGLADAATQLTQCCHCCREWACSRRCRPRGCGRRSSRRR
jgi:hypothetical protein